MELSSRSLKRKSLPANRSEGEPPSKRPRNSNSGYYCALPCCSHRSTDTSLSFHRFPADVDRRKLWVAAIRRDVGRDFTITGNTRVCSSHFKECDFLTATSINTALVNRRLRTSAVPSVFSWSVPVKSRRTLTRLTTTSGCGSSTSAESLSCAQQAAVRLRLQMARLSSSPHRVAITAIVFAQKTAPT